MSFCVGRRASTLVPALAFMVAVLSGCHTTYRRMGLKGGYDDRRVGPTLFYVEVKGNGFTRQITLVGYFHRRASELCQSIGYAYSFDWNTTARTTTSPTTYSADTTFNSYGAHTQISENPGMSVTKYGVSGYVNCNTPLPQYAAVSTAPPSPENPSIPAQPLFAPTSTAPRAPVADTPTNGSPPLTIADAITRCREVERDTSIPIHCESDYIQGAPSIIMGFRDVKDADSLLGAMSKHVAAPFCVAANSANRAANVYVVLGGKKARRYSCEMGAWGEWVELNTDDQKQFAPGTQRL